MRTRTTRGAATLTLTRAAASPSVTQGNSMPSAVRSHPSARVIPIVRVSIDLPLDRAEGEAPDEIALQRERHHDVRQHHHDGRRAHLAVERPGVGVQPGDDDRKSLRLDAAQAPREEEL